MFQNCDIGPSFIFIPKNGKILIILLNYVVAYLNKVNVQRNNV